MSDEPFRFAINPIVAEANARLLINTMASFPDGARSEDLRIRFEEITGLKRQSYYDSLALCKHRRWIVGGGKGAVYRLNEDGSWKPLQTSAGEILERDRLEYLADSRMQQIEELQGEVERLRDWSSGSDANGDANIALSSLVRIVGDSAASTRQRIRAAVAVLGYKVHDDGVTEFVRRFLESVCADADIATDYRIEAGELLRRHEAPRIMSEIVRPTYRQNEGSEASRIEAWRNYEIKQRELEIILATKDVPPPGWDDDLLSDNYVPPPEGWPGPAPQIPLRDLVVARRARADRMKLDLLASPEATPQMKQAIRSALATRNGNGSDS